MALVSLGRPHGMFGPTGGSTYDAVMDASGEKCAWVFKEWTGGSLVGVAIRTSGVTSSQPLKVSVQGVNASFQPDGTIRESGNASATIASVTSNTNYEVTFTTPTTLTFGTLYAIVVEFDSTAGDVDITIGFSVGKWPDGSYNYQDGSMPWFYTTQWWSAGTNIGHLALKYSGPGYVWHPAMAFGVSNSSSNWSNASSPDERGLKITVPVGCRAVGIWSVLDTDDNDCELVLYNASSTAVGTITVGPVVSSTAVLGYWLFSTPVTLTKDAVYRIIVKPTSTNSVSLQEPNLPTGASDCWAAQGMGGLSAAKTTRTDAGSWTDDTTPLTSYSIGLLIDQIDIPAGGGGMAGIGSKLLAS